ncbi:MAG: lytic murein transglycosylase [Xanthomonadaceae bacterium]|nr:lytic murein transglycosylase [Xanthomonadaceae bacterium]
MQKNTLIALSLAALMTACAPLGVQAELRPEYREFVDEMATKHGLDREFVTALLAGAEMRQDIIDAMTRPAEALPWHRYRRIFMTDARVSGGVRFWNEYEEVIARAAREYGVAPEIIVAIIGVESNYGSVQGRYRVVDALVTLGFHYPPRAAFFRSELEHFLLLAREEQLDAAGATGSYAGAMGSPQFISSSYRAYAVDFDGSGSRDLWNSWPDVGALRAAGVLPARQLPDDARANLLMLETSEEADEHWVTLHNFFVITRYNRSPLYAMAVHQLAQAIREAHDTVGSE